LGLLRAMHGRGASEDESAREVVGAAHTGRGPSRKASSASQGLHPAFGGHPGLQTSH
jgi:hypothetical protein